MYDVVIAGAGPVGLFLACELRLADVSVVVLEQANDPRSPLKRLPFGRRGLWAPALEAFYRRGLLDDLASTPTKRVASPTPPAGHFAGIMFDYDDIDPAKWEYRLPTPAFTNMASDMEHIETVLGSRAGALGVEIRRGLGVDDFEQSDEEVIIRAGDETFHARWLVGCDGARSTVRKKGGFEFAGTEPEFTGYSLQLELADPEKLRPGRNYTPTGMYQMTQRGALSIAHFDGGAFHRTEPITLEHVQSVLRFVSGTDVTVSSLTLVTTWTDRAFQAATYRNGRVFLAGDAAHIHSPLGGQGLSLGFGDALNLGWKLAAMIRGKAPVALLDTYTAERHPVGADVLDWSRAQVALMRPAQASRALETIIRDLIDTRDGATYFAERVWGVSLRYDLGEGHPLVGRSAPDFELANGTRLGELLRTGRALLLDFANSSSLRTIAGRWGDRIEYVASDVKDRLGLSAVLVRPDGFVAWASDAEPDCDEVARIASRWFGEPE
ncbi:MAG TPA: FAD-dependent monooxygenase [Gemmatimonadaceae bacterium]|jgi:2-polyprenyl-6-methoxyphenol hydroxylase-like FAD-dependent oxidoreductase